MSMNHAVVTAEEIGMNPAQSTSPTQIKYLTLDVLKGQSRERQRDVEMKRCRQAKGSHSIVGILLCFLVIEWMCLSIDRWVGDWDAGQNIYAGCPDEIIGIHLPHPQCHDNRVFIYWTDEWLSCGRTGTAMADCVVWDVKWVGHRKGFRGLQLFIRYCPHYKSPSRLTVPLAIIYDSWGCFTQLFLDITTSFC